MIKRRGKRGPSAGLLELHLEQREGKPLYLFDIVRLSDLTELLCIHCGIPFSLFPYVILSPLPKCVSWSWTILRKIWKVSISRLLRKWKMHLSCYLLQQKTTGADVVLSFLNAAKHRLMHQQWCIGLYMDTLGLSWFISLSLSVSNPCAPGSEVWV